MLDPTLPIAEILPALRDTLARATAAVVQAAPGAGKTTQVPLALLDAPWLAGRRIVMLEPRRLAARAAAHRMAALRGEEVGATIGYRTRLDSKVSRTTRIEVVTEGILTRRLQSDTDLAGVGLVMFDEFHERSLQGDLGLALTLDVQRGLRSDLRILVMSATIDGAAVAKLLGDAPVLAASGRSHPVDTRYLGSGPSGDRIEERMAAAVRQALREEPGDVLAFLPGEAEIRRTVQRLGDLGGVCRVLPLYGALTREEQDAAIRPSPAGERKIVLATAIAETSLTIEGVRVVIDSGLSRRPRFDPRSGLSGLETGRVSRASAEQRRGRAGRLGPGVCYRLWPEPEDRALAAFDPPEVTVADLTGLVLELAAWGVRDPATLAWLDPPPAAAVEQARALLRDLDAVDEGGLATPHGRAMTALGAHPRLAHMMIRGHERGDGATACDLAAILSERDVARSRGPDRDADLAWRLEALDDGGRAPAHGHEFDRAALNVCRRASADWQRRLDRPARRNGSAAAGHLVALAYPDRVAQRRGAAATYRLRNGRGAQLAERDPLARAPLLAIASLDDGSQNARVFLAAEIGREDIDVLFGSSILESDVVEWDERAGAVAARRQRRLGALVLDDRPLNDPPADAIAKVLIAALKERGAAALPWSDEAREWQARVMFLRRNDPAGEWPDVTDEALTHRLDGWLGPFLARARRLADVDRLPLLEALAAQLTWQQRQRLDRLAPSHLTVPSGSNKRLDYRSGETPVLAVKLQEMFGATATPSVVEGRVAVVLQLLSPAGRPVQITQDLINFWRTGYPAVRGELRGRYPRHPWPDDPLKAPPSARAKGRSR
jgi:ATP-dependent helicase HrpB